MNIHHLELFHHVAIHGGISKALRHMPYGIQQPAVSAQLIRLEKELGVTLFQRRPFALTPAGEELLAFAAPFFGRIDEVESSLRQGIRHLRIAAAEAVIREHLPGPLERLARQFPDLRISLRGLEERESLEMLSKGILDLVIGPESVFPPAGVSARVLAELNLALLAPESAPGRATESFLRRNAECTPLIALSGSEPLSRLFHEDLGEIGITWNPRWELPGLDLVHRYAGLGFGIGLTVRESVPNTAAGLRLMSLPGFRKLRLVAYYRRVPDDATNFLLDAVHEEADRRMKQARR
jgi:DNA-binding transcriptional LysR family regulator